jgi:hypothetical protein
VQIIRKGQQPARVPPGRVAALPRDVIVCGPDKPTVADIRVVNEFAAGLRARKAMTEKSAASYFKLTCGHYGSREVDAIMRDWNANRELHYCETCWNWFKVIKPEKANVPQEPLF